MHINKVVLLIATSIVSFCLGENFNETNAVSWLEQYGYITTSETAHTDITEILEQFQERYNLPVDGKLNRETMALMQKPRCTQGDNAYAVKSAWKKFDLKCLNSTAEGRTNFFAVLLHEVGHALGLSHSSDKKAVMYPFYQTLPTNISEDDKRGLEELYGPKSKSTSIPT
ncbi:matrix metalloproteinase-14-like [Diabrotica undecimpunctata]|uniref:matrix metalloproteinase-14-like n=1 Tax=Diabrotica undecimpunctata TaxID=50387 RepID=UPI003B641EEF